MRRFRCGQSPPEFSAYLRQEPAVAPGADAPRGPALSRGQTISPGPHVLAAGRGDAVPGAVLDEPPELRAREELEPDVVGEPALEPGLDPEQPVRVPVVGDMPPFKPLTSGALAAWAGEAFDLDGRILDVMR